MKLSMDRPDFRRAMSGFHYYYAINNKNEVVLDDNEKLRKKTNFNGVEQVIGHALRFF